MLLQILDLVLLPIIVVVMGILIKNTLRGNPDGKSVILNKEDVLD